MHTILIVEDDTPIQEFLAMALADEGYKAVSAIDGSNALEMISEYHPDLILLDIQMPTMNGRVFLETYHRTFDEHVPVVIITAGRNIDIFAELGAQGFVSKPFNLDELLAVIQHLLSPQ
jgi:two-component system, OmpR family, response regulator MprA